MSIIVASGSAISNSPLNHSKSKQLFSFSKAERFPTLKTTGDSNSFYTLPEVRMTRSTIFGYGTKFDFTAAAKGKSNQIYNSGSDFDPRNPHSPRYTFGLGRDKFTKCYCEGAPNMDLRVPGPGKYSILKPFGHEASKFTMKARTKSCADMSSRDNPGPGTYFHPIQINPSGKYVTSNIRNVPQINLLADKSQRSGFLANKNPGPLDYPQKQLIGHIFDSRHISSHGRTIYGKCQVVDSRANYPGPGAYRAPSEFGIYESKNAKTIEDKYSAERKKSN